MVNDIIESVQRQSDIVDKIAEVAFYRGKITKRVEIRSKVYKAFDEKLIDLKTLMLIEQILSEE
jgi:hypothetical protein